MALTPARAVTATLRALLQTPSGPEFIEEFYIPRHDRRADLVTITAEEMHAYEIKTAQDTLRRLPLQVLAYDAVFDHCTLVIAPKHEKKLEAMLPGLPAHWGLWRIQEDGEIERFREAALNPRINLTLALRLIWRDEAAVILRELGEKVTSRDPASWRRRRIRELTTPEEAMSLVRRTLLERDPSSAKWVTKRYWEQIHAQDVKEAS